MTSAVRTEIEAMLGNFGREGRPPHHAERELEQNRVIGSSGQRVIEIQPSTHKRPSKTWRPQKREWKKLMDEAGCRLPFPQEREDVHQILAYVLGRLVARRISPQNAEAVVHVCKLMLRV